MAKGYHIGQCRFSTPDKGKIPALTTWIKKGKPEGAGDLPKATQLGWGRGKTDEFQLRGPHRAAGTLRSEPSGSLNCEGFRQVVKRG